MFKSLAFLFLVTSFVGGAEKSEQPHDDPLEKDYGKIHYAVVLIRHGERNPLNTYPNDPYVNHTWIGGTANLNKKGKLNLFELGKWFRKRYNHLINGNWVQDFQKRTFTMHASNAYRTLQSGMYLQYGFYKIYDEFSRLEEYEKNKWMAIPIQIISREKDNVIAMWRQNHECEYFAKWKEHLYTLPTSKDKFIGLNEVLQYIGENAGYNFTNMSLNQKYDVVANLYDSISSQHENNVGPPDWAAKILPEPFTHVATTRVRVKNRDPICLRFTAGPLLKLIMNEMKEHKEQDSPALHFFIGHDYILQDVLASLDVFDGRIPPYATAAILELRKKEDLNIVTMSLKNSTGAAYPMEIPACGPLCDFKSFSKLITNCLSFSNWEEECQKPFP